MLGHGNRLPSALGVAAIAAGGATLLLRPRPGVVAPAAANAGDYFTSGELHRAHDWSAPQRLIGLGSMALDGGALALLAARRPARPRRPAVAAAALTTGLTMLGLPLSALSERRARAYGLSTQTWGPWAEDVAKSTAIGALFAAGGGEAATALISRFPRRWWIPASAAIVGFSTLMVFLAPIVIDPIFNKFEPLPEGPLRDEVLNWRGARMWT